MNQEKTLRDELAMSMPPETIPELRNEQAIEYFSKILGIKFGTDPFDQVVFGLTYQSVIRYLYADAMLEARQSQETGLRPDEDS